MLKLLTPSHKSEDLQTIVKWLNNPALMKYSEQRRIVHTMDTQRRYVCNTLSHGDEYQLAYRNNVLIGSVSANIDHLNQVANVGILIGPEHGAAGLGTEVWRLFCKILAGDGIRKIEGGCMAQNKAMIRIFEKNDMRLEGTRRHHFQIGKGQYDDMVLYGKLT